LAAPGIDVPHFRPARQPASLRSAAITGDPRCPHVARTASASRPSAAPGAQSATAAPPGPLGTPRPGHLGVRQDAGAGMRYCALGAVTRAATATGPSPRSPSGLPSVRARPAPSEALPPGGAAAPARPARPRSADRHYNLPHDQLTSREPHQSGLSVRS
jgi:hypothetical protein